jgi:hypothetical protein
MKLIETKTLSTAQASIEFTSIPQTFTDLFILASVRSTRGDFPVDGLVARPNGSSSNLSWRRLLGSGVITASETGTNDGFGLIPTAQATANTFSNGSFYLSNYTAATNKSFSMDFVTESNSTSSYFGSQIISAGLWSNTAPITFIDFTSSTGANLVAGCTISIYGILKGSDGIVTTTP